MLSPRCSKSSPVLAITSSSSAGRTRLRPSASFAPPIPPESATTSRLLIGTYPRRRTAPGQTAHDHDGLPFGALPHHQRRGGGDLVRMPGDADLQFAAVQIGRTS